MFLEARRRIVRYVDRCVTCWARPFYFSQIFSAFRRRPRWLQDRALATLVTVWANPMRWFGACGLSLKDIGRRPIPHVAKLVTDFLAIPCFEASNFCFKRAYLLNQRRLRRIGLYCASLGGQQFWLLSSTSLALRSLVRSQRRSILYNISDAFWSAPRALPMSASPSLSVMRRLFTPNSSDWAF